MLAYVGVLGNSPSASASLAPSLALLPDSAPDGARWTAERARTLTRELVNIDIDNEDTRVFCIGANKAGTASISVIYGELGFRTCHGRCDDHAGNEKRMWSSDSTKHDERSPLWRHYNQFADHGNHADYEWLDTTFPNSRFVLNTRGLQSWLLSRYEHMRTNKEAAGCSSRALDGDECSISDDEIAGMIVSEARHQQKVIDYFNATSERRQRFVVVDVEGWSDTVVMQSLRWVVRRNTTSYVTDMLLNESQWGEFLRLKPTSDKKMAGMRGEDAGGYPVETQQAIERVLRDTVRCPSHLWKQPLYAGCAAYVQAHTKLSESHATASVPYSTSSPTSPAPSPPVWTLGKEAKSYCPAGMRNARLDECFDAITSLVGKSNLDQGWVDKVNEGWSSDVPSGCSYDRRRKRAVYNTNRDNSLPLDKPIGYYALACTNTTWADDEPVNSTAKSLGLAVCVTGQLGRMELRSKVANLLDVLGPSAVGLFLSVEKGEVAYVNPGSRPKDAGCDDDLLPDDVIAAFGPYLRGYAFPDHKTFPIDVAAYPGYRPDVCLERRVHHLMSHHAQHRHDKRCYWLMAKEEARTGGRYDAVLRLRDNSVITSPFDPLKLINTSSTTKVAVKACMSWQGVNDKLIVVPRALAKPVFALPIDYMMSISKSPPDQTRSHAPTMRQIAKQVSNSETLLQALLDEFGVHALRYSSDMPVMDARCRHRTTPPDATPDFWKGTLDLSGKVFCSVPECKDCEASKEPWSLSGFDRCPRDAMSCSDKDICGEHKDLYRMVFIPGAPDNVSTVQTDAVLD